MKRTTLAATLAAVVALCAAMLGIALPANAANCTPAPIASDEVSNFTVTASDGSGTIYPYQAVKASLDIELADGHCAGDSITITVPDEMYMTGFSDMDLTNEAGDVVARATLDGQNVTITLTDFVETHQGVTLTAWWTSTLSAEIEAGQTQDLVWVVDGKTVTTPITAGECPGCEQMTETAGKFGSHQGDRLRVILETPTATRDGQEFRLVDTLTSVGQSIDCATAPAGDRFSTRTAWGDPADATELPVTVDACSDTVIDTRVTLNEGEQGRVGFWVTVTNADASPWTDRLTVTSEGEQWERSIEIQRRDQGGGGDGTNTPEPTTPEPTTSEPSSPEPTTPEPTTPQPTETTPEPTEPEPSSTSPEPSSTTPTETETVTPEPSTSTETETTTSTETTTATSTTDTTRTETTTTGGTSSSAAAEPEQGGSAETPGVVQTDGGPFPSIGAAVGVAVMAMVLGGLAAIVTAVIVLTRRSHRRH